MKIISEFLKKCSESNCAAGMVAYETPARKARFFTPEYPVRKRKRKEKKEL